MLGQWLGPTANQNPLLLKMGFRIIWTLSLAKVWLALFFISHANVRGFIRQGEGAGSFSASSCQEMSKGEMSPQAPNFRMISSRGSKQIRRSLIKILFLRLHIQRTEAGLWTVCLVYAYVYMKPPSKIWFQIFLFWWLKKGILVKLHALFLKEF